MKNTLKSKTASLITKLNKAKVVVTTGAMSLLTLPTSVYAATPGDTTGASDIVGNVIRTMVQIGGGLAGAIFLIIGLIKLLTAYHNGQPQEMHASIKDLIVGAAFAALAIIIGPAMGALGL